MLSLLASQRSVFRVATLCLSRRGALFCVGELSFRIMVQYSLLRMALHCSALSFHVAMLCPLHCKALVSAFQCSSFALPCSVSYVATLCLSSSFQCSVFQHYSAALLYCGTLSFCGWSSVFCITMLCHCVITSRSKRILQSINSVTIVSDGYNMTATTMTLQQQQ